MIFRLSIEKTNHSAHPTIFCFCFPDDSLIIKFGFKLILVYVKDIYLFVGFLQEKKIIG